MRFTLCRMQRKRFVIVLCLSLFSVTAFAQDKAAKIREFEAFAAQMMQVQQMPGLSVAVVDGDFRWSRGFGFADLENMVPATDESSYRMGSVSKPMTAAAVLRLADEGKLDLDAEVQTYVPYFPRKPFPITIRQLLAHQGGISHYRDYNTEGRIKDPKSTREAIAIFADFDLVNEPGTKYQYSSYGYNLLGAVVEEVSKQPFGTYMNEQVWKPLGMTSTIMDDPRAIVPHRVDGYTLDAKGRLQRSEYVDISSRFGGGGTRSTVKDMVRLMEGLAEGKVLKNETREIAWSMRPTRDQRLTRYGLGFGLFTRNGRYIVAHSGSQQETRTGLLYIPSAKVILALATNFEDADLDPFEEKLMELFLDEPEPMNVRGATEPDSRTWETLNTTYEQGLAYYDRFGRALTTNPKELAAAFKTFRELMLPNGNSIADAAQPLTGRPLVIVGSHIASVLAADHKDAMYRDGALRFFADYAKVAKQHKLDKALVARIATWSGDWNRVFTPEVRAVTFHEPEKALDTIERNREIFASSALKPNYERGLIALAERDPRFAKRALSLGVALYPDSKPLRERLEKLPR
jgi:CubicO group peptidase (beta-lactamase class C family)